MKRLLVVGAVALFASMNAQETETVGFNMGNTFITGNVGFTSTNFDDSKDNAFTIAPSVGYFVSPNVAIGARVGFATLKSTDEIANVKIEDKTNTFTAGAFGRYYFTPASRFSLFGELNANYATAKVTADNGVNSTSSKSNGFNFGLAPGINYFLSNHFALEAAWGVINYSSVKPDVDGAIATDTFSVGLNLDDISLGLVYKF